MSVRGSRTLRHPDGYPIRGKCHVGYFASDLNRIDVALLILFYCSDVARVMGQMLTAAQETGLSIETIKGNKTT